MVTTNLSFKKILHLVQDQICEVDLEINKDIYDKYREQQQKYILSEITRWEEKHKAMIKELEG